MIESRPVRIAIVGPTAVGKTAVSIVLAQSLSAEIVSADSMQVYRHMDIGTAKPSTDEQRQAHFHLIDMVEPDAEWTLADYQAAAESACDEIALREKLPLIVGGTGLYIRSLTTRLEIPSVTPNEALREELRNEAEEFGNERIHERLRLIDPKSADRIHVNDVKRIVRALEVHAALGVTMTQLHEENQTRQTGDRNIIIGLNFADRRKLYAQIEVRVDEMIAAGFVDEVKRLLDSGYGPELKPMQSLGYRHICEYLSGNRTLDAAVEEMKSDTRHYARRQLIWFRGDKRVRWIDVDGRAAESVALEIEQILGTNRSMIEGNRGNEQTAT